MRKLSLHIKPVQTAERNLFLAQPSLLVYIQGMDGKKPLLLRLLLIAIMVLQPVVSAHAMTAMDHDPGSAASPAMHDHEMDHGSMHQTTDEDAASASAGDCCTSNATCPMAACPMSACSAALFTDSISVLKMEITLGLPPYQSSWASISLPTETRPPRSLLG